jgi:hypothetical protein
MSQQRNKNIKRRRRKNYIKRVRARHKAPAKKKAE